MIKVKSNVKLTYEFFQIGLDKGSRGREINFVNQVSLTFPTFC